MVEYPLPWSCLEFLYQWLTLHCQLAEDRIVVQGHCGANCYRIDCLHVVVMGCAMAGHSLLQKEVYCCKYFDDIEYTRHSGLV